MFGAMEKKSMTVKEVLTTDKGFLYDLAESKDIKPGEAFSLLIENWKQRLDHAGFQQENLLLKKQIEEITAENKALQEAYQAIEGNFKGVCKDLDLVNDKIKVFTDRVTDLEKALKAEQDAPASDKLTDEQFICELDKGTAVDARTVRKFAKRDGYIPADIPDRDYPSALANVAIKAFLKENFSSIIKKR